MKRKIKIVIFFNNLKGLQIYNNIKSKINIIKIILSKKYLNRKVVIKLSKEKNKFLIVKKFDKKILNKIKKLNPDIFLVCGFPIIFSSELLSLPRMGSINCHSGPLPNYRGGSPLNWQIINNEKIAGISIIKMNKFIDRGDIIVEKNFEIQKNYDINKLHQIANKLFIKHIPIAIDSILNGVKLKKQNHKKAKYFRQRTENDGIINWNKMSSLKIYNLIRALCDPYPGAFTYYRGKKIKFLKSKIIKSNIKLKPGQFFKKNKLIFIKCKSGLIKILKYKGVLPITGKFADHISKK